MAGPNMAAITATLERSLQNCSLNNHQSSSSSSSGSNGDGVLGSGVTRRSSSRSDSIDNHLLHDLSNSSDTSLELNSQISLPYHWEQCLDLKTGEIYYINWRTGMKAKEDPRTTAAYSGDFYSEDDSCYDSEGSSSELSPSSTSRDRPQQQQDQNNDRDDHVLVVAGCKGCLMYFMVPKQVEDCPKCCAQLLHFDRSDNSSP